MSLSVQLTLEGQLQQTKQLNFRVFETPVARRWAECLQKSGAESRIRESHRVYNFPLGGFTEDELFLKINACVATLHAMDPDRIPLLKMKKNNFQEMVNQIHHYFVDSDRMNFKEMNPKVWDDLNVWLHAYESFSRSAATARDSGIPEANIVVTWENPFHEELCDEDYRHFTIKKHFGYCYINYCQTGRHLWEMFLANDQIAADDHISPLRRLSADTYIWLGTTTGPKSYENKIAQMKSWFEANQTRLESLGFFWGDPKLAIGWIPVAQLIDPPEIKDQLAFLVDLGSVAGVKEFCLVGESG